MEESRINDIWNEEVKDISEQQIKESLAALLNRINLFESYKVKKLKRAKRLTLLFRTAGIFLLLLSISSIVFFANNNGLNNTKKLISRSKINYIEHTSQIGEIKKIILSDNTIVFLNSGSKLIVPEKFDTKNRSVTLSGEAYFDVTKDEKRPFFVKTDYLDIKVLGTTFCVQAFPSNKDIETTLVSGSVYLSSPPSQYDKFIPITLSPGQHLHYTPSNGELEINQVNVSTYTSWIHNVIVFENTPINTIIRRLEIQFGVSIKYNKSLENHNISAKFIHNESLQEILELLSDVAHFKYHINKDQILLE